MGHFLLNPLVDATIVGAPGLLRLTVPTDRKWTIHHLHILFIATSDSGTRTVSASLFTEDGETMGRIFAATNVTLSQTLQAVLSVLDTEPGGDVAIERPLQAPLPLFEGMYIETIDSSSIEDDDTLEYRGVIWEEPNL